MSSILAIDRSTSQGSWALFRDGERLAGAPFEERLPRSPTWFPALLEGLEGAGLRPGDIAAFVVGTGPGSFSGIRAVLSAIQGLALPGGAPVLGLPSAAALAYAAFRRTGSSRVAVVGDARRGALWLAAYDFAEASAADVAAAPALVPSAELALPAGALVVSPDFTRLAAALRPLAAATPGSVLEEGDAVPAAEDLVRLHFAYPAAAVRDPLPVYLHPAVAAAAAK